MKNKNLLKIIGITLGILILLSWIIPVSTADVYSKKITLDAIKPFGIWDIVNHMDIVIGNTWQYCAIILAVGGFYGVLLKTGALKNLVSNITKSFKGKEKWLLAIITAAFMLAASITGIYLPLFVFVPLFVAVILSMGYNKIIALIATVGAIILGNMNVFYNDYVYQTLGISKIPHAWFNVILLAITMILTIFNVVTLAGKKKEKEEVDKDLLLSEVDETKGKKKKVWPIVTILVVTLVVMILGMVPWSDMFGWDVFTKFHTSVISYKLFNFPVFQNLLGSTMVAFGKWTATNVATLLVLVSIVTMFVYRIKFTDAWAGFVGGMKKLLPVVLVVFLVNLAVGVAYYSNYFITIINFFLGISDKFNVIIMAINTFIANVLTIDNGFVAGFNMPIISGFVPSGTSMHLLAFIQQTMYGLSMLVAPTSVVLFAGLAYLEIDYKKWWKNIWKLFVALLIVTIIVLLIASAVKL